MNFKLIACIYCHCRDSVRKHGRARTGYRRYYCRSCKKTFQDKYIYNHPFV